MLLKEKGIVLATSLVHLAVVMSDKCFSVSEMAGRFKVKYRPFRAV